MQQKLICNNYSNLCSDFFTLQRLNSHFHAQLHIAVADHRLTGLDARSR